MTPRRFQIHIHSNATDVSMPCFSSNSPSCQNNIEPSLGPDESGGGAGQLKDGSEFGTSYSSSPCVIPELGHIRLLDRTLGMESKCLFVDLFLQVAFRVNKRAVRKKNLAVLLHISPYFSRDLQQPGSLESANGRTRLQGRQNA